MKCHFKKAQAFLFAISISQAQAFDLLEAWQSARSNDPVFGVAQAEAEAGKTKSLQAQALKRPQVTANAGLNGVNSDNKITNARFSAPGLGSANGANFRTKTDAGFDLNWNIRAEYSLYDATKTNSINQLNKQAELAGIQLTSDEQNLMLRVAQAYFDTLIAEDTVRTFRSQLVTVARTLEIAKARFKEGDAAVIEVHETQARFDLLTAQELEASANLQILRAALSDITNNQNDVLARLPQKVDLQNFMPGDMNAWLVRARSNNQLIQMQQLQQDIAHEEIGKHQAKYSPVLNAVALAGGDRLDGLGSSDANLTNHQASLGLQLTVPLYTGGMRDAKYQEALALEEKARQQTEVVKQQSVSFARSAWMEASVGQAQIKAMEQAERSAEIKLDSTRLGNEVGDRTTLDVLNSEQELYNTRLVLYRTRYQVLLATLRLAAAAGELNEQRLNEVNQMLHAEN